MLNIILSLYTSYFTHYTCIFLQARISTKMFFFSRIHNFILIVLNKLIYMYVYVNRLVTNAFWAINTMQNRNMGKIVFLRSFACILWSTWGRGKWVLSLWDSYCKSSQILILMCLYSFACFNCFFFLLNYGKTLPAPHPTRDIC